MDDDVDLLIQKNETALQPLRSRMEELRQQFTKETIKFAAKWYQETATFYVTKYSEITLNLNKEKIAAMKAKVNELTKNAEKNVKNTLSDPTVWWHQTPRKHDSSALYEQLGNEQVGNKFPDIVDKPVRNALGELGTVLEQFGYKITTKGALSGAYPEFWFEYPQGTTAAPRPYFPHLLEWSEEMKNTIQKYNNLFKKAVELYNEVEKLKEEKKKRQAKKLWDST